MRHSEIHSLNKFPSSHPIGYSGFSYERPMEEDTVEIRADKQSQGSSIPNVLYICDLMDNKKWMLAFIK